MITKEDKTKVIWLSAIGALIVIAVIVYVVRHSAFPHLASTLPAQNSQSTVSQPAVSSTTPTASSQSSVGDLNAKAYNAALVKYAKTRIQFSSCHATPTRMALTNESTIMLDNRSASTADISLDGKMYYLAGLGYRIVTLNEPSLPAYSFIDCNSSKNVAELVIER